MDRSSRTSGGGWGGTAAGSLPANAPQADSRLRPSSNAAGGTLMDLVASSSRSRPQQPAASLPPRTATPPSQSPFAASPWDYGSGAESINPGVMPQGSSGSWRASVGGGDLMSVLAESARRSELGQFYPAGTLTSPGYGLDASAPTPIVDAGSSTAQLAQPPSTPGTWRDGLGGNDLMSVLAESARRSELGQFYPAGTLTSPGYGLDASAPTPIVDAGGSTAQLAQPPSTPGTWRDGLGGNDLMSVVAESARRSARPQFYAAGTVPSPGYGLDARAWPPFAEAGGSSAAQPVPPPATWRDSFADGGLMSVVAHSVRGSQPPQLPSSGSALPMRGERRSTMVSFANAAAPAEWGASSRPVLYPLPASALRQKMSQAQFDTLAGLVQSGMSLSKALIRLKRTDVADGTARRALRLAGVEIPRRTGASKRPSLSVAQIETARQVLADFVSRNGTTFGAVAAAHQSLGEAGGNYSTFRDYFDAASGGLSAHGRVMLEQARAFESRAAREDGSGPAA